MKEELIGLIDAIEKKEVTRLAGKDILREALDTDGKIRLKLGKATPEEIRRAIDTVLNKNEKAVKDYKKGKKNAFEFLIGESNKVLRKRAEPRQVRKELIKKLL